MDISNLPPEYINANSTGSSLVKASVVTALSTIFVGLRFFARFLRKMRIGLDDWLILLAMLIQWGLYVIGILYSQSGALGRHVIVIDKTNPQAIVKMELYFFAGDFLYATVLATTKWSILVLYRRLFPTKFMKWSTAILATVVTAWWLACIFVSAFRCHPISKSWDPFTPGTCLDTTKIFIGKAVPNFSTDFIMLGLPLVELSKLHAKLPQKIALGFVFMLGALACISSVYRFKEVLGLSKQDTDITWVLPGILLWTIVETSAGIISACLPLMRPLLTWISDGTGFTRLISSKSSKNTGEPRELVTIGGSGGKKDVVRDSTGQSTSDGSRTMAGSSMEHLRENERAVSPASTYWAEEDGSIHYDASRRV